MAFKTQFNDVPTQDRFEKKSDKPSLTIPDQTMPVSEIMRRYASGLPLSGERVPVYHGEDEFLPDFNNLDLSEIEDLKNNVRQEIETKKQTLQNIENEKAKKLQTEREKALTKRFSNETTDEGRRVDKISSGRGKTDEEKN